MKKVLSMIIGLMFLFAVSAFADNAATVKVGVEYLSGSGKVTVLGTGTAAQVKLYVLLLDKNGNPADKDENGNAISGTSPSITVTSNLFTGITTTCSSWMGASAVCTVDYSAVTTPYPSGTTNDELTVKVGSLSVKGNVAIASPTANNIQLVLPGLDKNKKASPKILDNVLTFPDNDDGYQYRYAGDEVPYYVYATNGTLFTDSLNDVDVTISSADGESTTCTLKNGICSGTLKLTKFNKGSYSSGLYTETITASATIGSSTVSDTSTVKFKPGTAASIGFFNPSDNATSVDKLKFFDNTSDKVSVCPTDSDGNIVQSATISAIAGKVNDATLNDNVTIANSSTTPCIEIWLKDADGVYPVTETTLSVTAKIGADNVTKSITVYADNDTAKHHPTIIGVSDNDTVAGQQVTITLAEKDNTSKAPNSALYNINDYTAYIGTVAGKLISTNASAEKWTMVYEFDTATTGTLFVKSSIDSKLDADNNTTFKVSPDISSAKVNINFTTSGYYVADGTTKNELFVDNGTNVTITDKYGNDLSSVAKITAVTSKLGVIYKDTSGANDNYTVTYPLGTSGKDTITITAGGASSTIDVENIVAPSKKFILAVAGYADYNEFASYYANSPVKIKVCSDAYLTDNKTFNITVDNNTLKIYDDKMSKTVTSGSLPSGYQGCSYYYAMATAEGTFTVTVSDPSTASPWDNVTLTLTFSKQDKNPPTLTSPEVTAGGITFTAKDDNEVKNILVKVYDADDNLKTTDNKTYDGKKEVSYKLLGLDKGTYLFEITVKDAEGNSVEKSYVRTISEAAPSCSADNLDYCTTQTDCEDAGGVWKDGTCSAPAPVTEATPELEATTGVTAPTKTVTVSAVDNVTVEPKLTIASGDTPEEYYLAIQIGNDFYLWTGGTNFVLYKGGELSSVAEGSYSVDTNTNTVTFYLLKSGSLKGVSGSFNIWYGYKAGNAFKYNAFTLTVK